MMCTVHILTHHHASTTVTKVASALLNWRMTINLPNIPHPNILLVKKIANQALN